MILQDGRNMRDKNRINRIMAKFTLLWEEMPDMRFCQLVSNLTNKDDIFYVEDTEFEKKLDEMSERFLVVKPQDKE